MEATINQFGDLVCPVCKANIITPAGCEVQAGEGQCVRCSSLFTVTEDTAKAANANAAEKAIDKRD